MIELYQNKYVTFNEADHEYFTEDGRELSGVTPILSRQLFPDQYKGIDESILQKAAEYGTAIHSILELYDTLGVDDDPICEEYARLTAGLKHVYSEYLVSDNRRVASKIDKVLTDDDESVILVDVKTTSTLHKEYVRWQLSIYAYLFRLQNPGIKVKRLAAAWLPKPQYGTPRLVELEPIEQWEVEALLTADELGEKYAPNGEITEASVLPTVAPDYWEYVKDIKRKAAEIAALKKEMEEKLLSAMQEFDVKKIDYQDISVTRKLPVASERVDTALLKEKFPDIYEQVKKTSYSKESILINIKDKK